MGLGTPGVSVAAGGVGVSSPASGRVHGGSGAGTASVLGMQRRYLGMLCGSDSVSESVGI